VQPEDWTLERGAPGFPPGLADLDRVDGLESPRRLHGRGARSLVAGLEPAAAVTIVGARRCTGYGRSVAAELAGSLAEAGLVVVSGMAFGVDSAAHEGALAAAGSTVAVLACGPDRAYPPSARSLYRRILESGGAVVSESPPGYEPGRWDFPRRNRLMAALAAMTVVVEATEPSGSRITAERAMELGRDVGAVPGPIGSRLSAGPHSLLREGAHFVGGAQDVLDRVLGVGAATATRVGPSLDAEGTALLGLVEGEGAGLERLTAASGMPAAAAAVALARLELLGYLRVDRGRYVRTGLSPPSS